LITENDLSKDQKAVYNKVLKWSRDKDDLILRIGGFAGTGKSTIISLLAKKFGESTAFCCFTGKAANVLRTKLDELKIQYSYCGTIHGLIYTPIVDQKTLEIIGWARKPGIKESLIVIDEASMVGGKMWGDLTRYGTKILVVGDHFQLPPINSFVNLMDNPDLRLEKIHRQAEGNPIIKLSMLVRQGRSIESFNVDDERVAYVSRDDYGKIEGFFHEMFNNRDPMESAVLSLFNTTRNANNRIIREICDRKSYPEEDDLVICLKNVHEKDYSVFNGMRGVVESCVKISRNLYSMEIDFPYEDIHVANNVCVHQFNQPHTFNNILDLKKFGAKVKKWSDVGLLFDYGYSMTVHKCLHPDTLVETPKGLCRVGLLKNKGIIATPKGSAEYCNFVKNDINTMLEITTIDGFRIRVTPEHGIDVWDDQKGYIKKQAKDVNVNDLTRLKLGYEWADQKLIQLHKPLKGDVREEVFDTPDFLNEKVAEFLGIMVADGCLFGKGFRVAKRHKDYIDHFSSLCKDLFGYNGKRFFNIGAFHCEIHSKYLERWLKGFDCLLPNNKKIPDLVLKSNIDVQAAFLRGLFEDGSVHLKNNKFDYIEFSSANDQIIRDVKTLLLRFGIISGTVIDNKGRYRILIYSANAKRFEQSIGFISNFKKERLKSNSRMSETRYFVPVLSSELEEIVKSNGGRKCMTNTEKNAFLTFKMSRDVVRRFLCRMNNKTEGWHKLNNRIYFHHSKIKSIVKIEDSESVCIEVPGENQFIQDGFCGWNSQGSQFENVMVFIERLKGSDDEYFNRWLYTAITRSSINLALVH